jgi:hypothetical protein
MPSHDGFVRQSSSHCDHNRSLLERCDPCTAGNRRCYSVHNGPRLSRVIVSVLQLDTPWLFTYDDMTDNDVYALTSRLADAGWSQSTSSAA